MPFGMQRPPAYDLTLRFNEQIRTEVALEALWQHPSLEGPYTYGEDEQPVEVPLAAYFTADFTEGHGYASFADANRIPCVVTYELWPDAPAKVLRVSLDAADAEPRLNEVDAWMAELGKWVWRSMPFKVGVVGDSFVSDWTSDGFWPELPLRQSFGILWPDADGPIWFPPTDA